MKRTIKESYLLFLSFTFFLLILFTFCGCNDEKTQGIYKGTATAYKNGAYWTAECTALLDSPDSGWVYLYVDKYNEFGEKIEGFLVTKIRSETGTFKVFNWLMDYQLIPFYGSYYGCLTADSDPDDGGYFVLDSDSNYIQITTIDLVTGDFTGKFTISYFKDATFNFNPSLPDTIRFSDGEFQTKISRIEDIR